MSPIGQDPDEPAVVPARSIFATAGLGVAWALALFLALPGPTAVAALPAGLLLLAARHAPTGTAWREALAVAAPLWLTWALHHPVLGSWWLGDDPCHLVQSLDYGLWRPYFEPVGYFLTPSLLLSLELDQRLFGLDPGGFFLHQLTASTVLVGATFFFLRAFLATRAAALAVTLFVASAPSWAVARQLMNRHYLEGLIAALAALWLFRRARATDRLTPAILGAAAYLLACTAKEVFAPLVALLPIVGGTGWRARPRFLVPYGVAALGYAVWRLSVRGVEGSFVAYDALSGDLGGAVTTRLAHLLGWPPSVLVALVLLLVAGVVLRAVRGDRAVLWAAALVALALVAPLLSLAGRIAPRHLFVPYLVVAATVILALWRSTAALPPSRREGLRWAVGLALLVGSLAGMERSPLARSLEPLVELYRSEDQALLESGREGLLITKINQSDHLRCLSRLKRDLLGRDEGPGFCGDPCFCAGAYPGLSQWIVDENGGFSPVAPPPPNCRVERTLEIEMEQDPSRNRLAWRLGPYSEGRYYALVVSGSEHPGVSVPVPVPVSGTLHNTEPLRFVIRYDSPEGWRTYSAVHRIEPGGRAEPEGPPRRPEPGDVSALLMQELVRR